MLNVDESIKKIGGQIPTETGLIDRQIMANRDSETNNQFYIKIQQTGGQIQAIK